MPLFKRQDPVRVFSNITATQTAASPSGEFFGNLTSNYAVIDFLPSRVLFYGVIGFTTTPASIATSAFSVIIPARQFSASNLNTANTRNWSITTESVTLIVSSTNNYKIVASSNSVPSSWVTDFNNNGMIGLLNDGKITNSSGGSLTTVSGTGGWTVAEFYR
jgi:hypothetical protein